MWHNWAPTVHVNWPGRNRVSLWMSSLEQSQTLIGRQTGTEPAGYWLARTSVAQIGQSGTECEYDWAGENRAWLWLVREEQNPADPELISSHSSAVTASLHVGELTAVTQSADNISSLWRLLHYVTVLSLLLPFFIQCIDKVFNTIQTNGWCYTNAYSALSHYVVVRQGKRWQSYAMIPLSSVGKVIYCL